MKKKNIVPCLTVFWATVASMAGATHVYAGFGGDYGVFVGADAGFATGNKFCDGVSDCDHDNTIIRLGVGYQFNNTWGVELGYASFGTLFKANDNNFNASQKAEAWTLSGVGSPPMRQNFGLFGQAGVVNFHSDNSGTVQGVAVKNSNDITPYIDAGAYVDITDQFDVRFGSQVYSDITRLDGSSDDIEGFFADVS